MRYFYLFCCYYSLAAALLLGPVARAQVPAWNEPVAALQASGTFFDPSLLATAPNGDVYLAGLFSGRVTLGGDVLTATHNNDFFVAKWSATTRQFIWGVAGQSTGLCRLSGLAVSGTSVYLAGNASDSQLTFGALPMASPAAGPYLSFVAKLTDAGPSGAFQWALPISGEQYRGSYGSLVSGLATTPTGVYLTGTSAGPTHVGALTVTGLPYPAAYVARLADAGAAGSCAQVQLLGTGPGGSQFTTTTALAAAGAHLYLTGQASGGVALGATSLPGAGTFVLRLTDTGPAMQLDWATFSPGLNPTALAVDGPSVVVGGTFTGSYLVGGTRLVSTALGPSSYPDLFVAKLLDADTSGRFQWAQQAGGRYDEQLGGLALRGSDIFIAGTYFNYADTSPSDYPVFGTTTLPRFGYKDIFLAKLTDNGASGAFAWAKPAGSEYDDLGNALTLGASGAVYVAATAYGPANFGRYYLPNGNNTSKGVLASVLSPTALAAAPAVPLVGGTVYPNPARQSAVLALPVPTAHPLTLALFNALGEQVGPATALPAGSRAVTLSLAGLAPGVYALRLAGGDQPLPTQRLVVE
ncbi:MAG: T9SS type A sorting domain-containing protein [Janthinobacterium lividum]